MDPVNSPMTRESSSDSSSGSSSSGSSDSWSTEDSVSSIGENTEEKKEVQPEREITFENNFDDEHDICSDEHDICSDDEDDCGQEHTARGTNEVTLRLKLRTKGGKRTKKRNARDTMQKEIKEEKQCHSQTCITKDKRIQELEEKLRQKDGDIMEQNNQMDTLEKQCKDIHELEGKLRKKDGEIKDNNHTIDALQKQINEEKQGNEQTSIAKNKRIQELEETLKKKDGEIKEKNDTIDSMKAQCKQYTQNQSDYDGKINQYEIIQKEQENDLKRLEVNNSALKRKLAESQTRLRHTKQEIQEKDRRLTEAEGMIKKLTEKVRVIEIEKEELLLRLSKVAGTKLTYNNPNIADLSDEKRPTKLAEEFSELYDNEWTDAFEYVDIENEQDKTSYMLCLLKTAYELCRSASQKHLTKIKTSICTLTLQGSQAQQSPHQEQSGQNKDDAKDAQTKYPEVTFVFDRFQDEHKKAVIELRKFVEVKLSSEFEKIAVDEISRELSVDKDKQEKLYIYITKCVNICWSMCRAEIPVAISFPDVHDGMHLDTGTFKPYTRTGKFIDYIVWPALYLHENGPLLCKGVAQGKA